MRGSLPGIESPVPIIGLLPGIYQDDLFTAEFTAGFDDVLAPVFATLDCLEAYVDPWLAPDDFLQWLAGWVGVTIDEGWPIDRTRAFIASIVEFYRWRGTARGLRAELAVYTGGEVEISETGGVQWSLIPNSPLPGEDVPRISVRIRVDDPSSLKERTIDEMIRAAKPAHVVHVVEITRKKGAR